ncbi:MAG: family 20 glycosylhydrolase [Chlorobi bacterium]|nr:family 20 glycosylhydrolase [Chlorobiota bacterium]
MNRILLFFLPVIFLFSCSSPKPPQVGIIPQPNSVEKKDGVFEINSSTLVYASHNPATMRVAKEFIDFIKKNYGLELKMTENKASDAIMFIRSQKKGVRKGFYQLQISRKKVKVISPNDAGVFYGMQTLKQLLTPVSYFKKPVLQCMEINDYPEFEWRGMMLDVSRHFFPKDSIKKLLDILAMHKMNKFHWHLTDGIGWRIQIDKYPLLTEKGAWRVPVPKDAPWKQYETCFKDDPRGAYGGYYTKEDIKEIVKYAAERYIDVIPEIEMPGHSEAALQCYPELQCVGEHNSGVYCAGNEQTFDFLQDVLYEVFDMFPSKFIHVGGDEVNKSHWLHCPRCRKRMQELGIKTGEELQSYFISRMEKFIHANGRKLIGWDEILEGGLPPRAAVMSWRGMKGGIEAARTGHYVVMTPGSPCYFDHSQGLSVFEPDSWGGNNPLMKVYDFYPVPKRLDIEGRRHILGGQANLWTEKIATWKHVEYMTLPRLSALAEVDWTNPAKKDRKQFIKNIDVQLDRFRELGYNYAESAFTPVAEVKYDKEKKVFVLTLHNELGLYDIRYTLDGTKPDINSTLYTGPVEFTKPIDLYAVCFRRGVQAGYPLIQQYTVAPSDKCSIEYKYPYSSSYSGGGDKALCDKKYAGMRGDDGHWQGFEKNDFDVVIDLGEPRDISYVALDFFQHLAATSVMLPLEVKIMISEDGRNYKTVFDEKYKTIKDYKPIIKKVEAKFPAQNAEYIHIIGKNRGTLPDWHIRKNTNAWLFVDEIMVK